MVAIANSSPTKIEFNMVRSYLTIWQRTNRDRAFQLERVLKCELDYTTASRFKFQIAANSLMNKPNDPGRENEFDSMDPGTTGESPFTHTIEAGDFSVDTSVADGNPTTHHNIQTVDHDAIQSSDLLRTLALAWSGTSISNDDPHFTLQAETKPPTQEKTTSSVELPLAVRDRDVRELNNTSDAIADYEILKILGEGGMGVVYDAHQTSMGRTVAVKMLKAATVANKNSQLKFLSEAVITADLAHPNIVPVYDAGRSSKGDLFYAMKRVNGTPWLDTIEENSVEQNIEILLRVSDAVAFAHAVGIVHRDLKPENIMLGDYGEVFVMDWGLAIATKQYSKNLGVITAGIGGTPAYMSPELAIGDLSRIGPASDIYLLGAILYQILTNLAPHCGESVTKCLISAGRNVIRPTKRSGELMDIALYAMASEPGDRFDSVKDFQDAIRSYEVHSNSSRMATRSIEELASAELTNNYRTFSKAVFGLEEAISMWPENEIATKNLARAKVAYSMVALQNGDLDLATSLLGGDDEGNLVLDEEIAIAQQVATRKRLLRRQRQAFGVLCAGIGELLIVGVGVTMWLRSNALNLANQQGPAARESNRCLGGVQTSLGALRGWVALNDPAFLKQRKSAWDDEIIPSLEELKTLAADSASDKRELAAIERLLEDLREMQWWIEDVAQSPGNRPALDAYALDVEPLANTILKVAAEMGDRLVDRDASDTALLTTLSNFRAHFAISQTQLLAYLNLGEEISLHAYRSQLGLVNSSLEKLSSSGSLGDFQVDGLVDWLEAELPNLDRIAARAIQIRSSPSWNTAQHYLRTEAVPVSALVTTQLETITVRNSKAMVNRSSRVSTISNFSCIVSVILAIAAFVCSWLVLKNSKVISRRESSNAMST
ncbi:MAG TPA: serine/threonine protein kinase [Planctomycetes bacterium]|nr:serine/threonine protein kinase [Planctomycetota bacterium]